jgi:hypothetical protein
MKSSRNNFKDLPGFPKDRKGYNRVRKIFEHYQKIVNQEDYIEQRTKHQCMSCGLPYPRELLDFHHLNPDEKEKSLTASLWGGSNGPPKKTLDEAEKCAILCKNCHALEHMALRNGESILDDQDAYIRYRDRRATRYASLADWWEEFSQRGKNISTSV